MRGCAPSSSFERERGRTNRAGRGDGGREGGEKGGGEPAVVVVDVARRIDRDTLSSDAHASPGANGRARVLSMMLVALDGGPERVDGRGRGCGEESGAREEGPAPPGPSAGAPRRKISRSTPSELNFSKVLTSIVLLKSRI